MEITNSFDEPYSGGLSSALLPSSFSPSVVGLNGRPYLIDTESGTYRRNGIEVVQQRNTGDPRDVLLLPQGVWRQSQSSWHYGAGQSNLDRENSLPFRFESSYGIDPWTQWQISVLPETERLKDLTGQTGSAFMAVIDNYLVVQASAGLLWYSSLAASATPTFQSLATTVVDMTDQGDAVIALLSNGAVVKATDPTTQSTHITRAGSTMVAYVKDYLILGDEHELYDCTDGTAKKIYTNPLTSFRWIDACEGSQFIYVLGGVNDKWMVHKIGLKSDGTGLIPAIVAVNLPHGEVGHSIGSYLGYIFIGTNKGVRMAQADSNGDLTLGAIIPTENFVTCFEGQGNFVWYGNSKISPAYTAVPGDPASFPTNPVCGLGRLDLTTFTTTALTPAYANDLVAEGETGRNVQSVVTWEGRRVFSVNGSVNGGGVYYEGTKKMDAAWLRQGIMSFSVEDLKNGLYQQAKWLPGQGKLALDLAFDSSGFSRYANLTVLPTNIRSANVSLRGVQFSRVNVRYVLFRSTTDTTKAPVMTRWELRATPVRGAASRWQVPIMNYDTIDIDGVAYPRDVTAELDALMTLVENGNVFVYQESGRSYQVHARDFEWRPEKLSANGKGWQGTFIIVIEEVI